MVEVFITDIQNNIQAEGIKNILQNSFLKSSYDLKENDLPYPCGHTILRVEGKEIDSDEIMRMVKRHGFNCEILEDKICN